MASEKTEGMAAEASFGASIGAVEQDLIGGDGTRKQKSGRFGDAVGVTGVFALFIGGWYLLSQVILPQEKRFLLPTPDKVIANAFLKWDLMEPIVEALWLSTRSAITGLAISIVLGMAIATAMSGARWVEKSLWPYLVGLQAAPILALTPLIGGLLGFNFKSRVFVVVLISIFPIVANTLFGLLSVEKGQHELFTLQGVSRWTRLTKLQFPAAMPSIFNGFRISAGLAVIGAIVGDVYFRQGEPGIGSLIDVYRQRLRGEEMIACIILSALLGIVFFWISGVIGRKAVGHWHETTRGT